MRKDKPCLPAVDTPHRMWYDYSSFAACAENAIGQKGHRMSYIIIEKTVPVKVYINSAVSELMKPEEPSECEDFLLSAAISEEDPVPSTDHIRYITAGTLTVGADFCRVSYAEREDMGFTDAETSLSFSWDNPLAVTMIRTGTQATAIRFDPEEPRQMVAYGDCADSMEFAVNTRAIENTVTEAGGEILLDYVIEINGIKTERTLFRLRVRPVRQPQRGSDPV